MHSTMHLKVLWGCCDEHVDLLCSRIELEIMTFRILCSYICFSPVLFENRTEYDNFLVNKEGNLILYIIYVATKLVSTVFSDF